MYLKIANESNSKITKTYDLINGSVSETIQACGHEFEPGDKIEVCADSFRCCEIKHKLEDKVDEFFRDCQKEYDITNGDIHPLAQKALDDAIDVLAYRIYDVLRMQK